MDNEKLNKTQDIIETPVETTDITDTETEEKEVFVLADTLPELDEEDEEETLEEIQPPKQEKSKKPENKAWQSKDFLELDDDMEFEFLDL